MESYHTISDAPIEIADIHKILLRKQKLTLSKISIEKIERCRKYLDDKMNNQDTPVYGVNTGFGSLCKVKISHDEIGHLQHNLIISHACGFGEMIPEDIIRIILLLKIQSLSYGYSGISLQTIQRLMDMYNADILPVIYEQGSLGASGDLCPLSHMSLPLIGMGKVIYKGEVMESSEMLKQIDWQPLQLQSKEGLALLNGTQFMSAYAVQCLILAKRIERLADLIACVSLDAWACRHDPFLPQIHKLRKQTGQIKVAENILGIMESSCLFMQPKEQVQDPYSFRCIPQVHGAVRDAVAYCNEIVSREINGVTDNPNIFPEEDLILSGGNFHGEPLALTLDFLAIALSELANISERRTYRLLSGSRGLPEFLSPEPGLNSGLMMPQYTAASIVSQNKQLCTPASVDSIASCNEQEDHVSMGANAATKCLRVVRNVEKVLAIELLTASQALEFRRPAKSGVLVEELVEGLRKTVPFAQLDRYMHEDMTKTLAFFQSL
ncbi:MAG: histidine ammonia-lyase [Chitinophagales bacterium]|nr:histidine ammonia-lyase [Chitinophagales bacterium]